MIKSWRGPVILFAISFAAMAPVAAETNSNPRTMTERDLHQAPSPPRLDLSAPQRDRVREVLNKEDTEIVSVKGQAKFQPRIGEKAPASVEAHPLPPVLVAEIPQLERYTYLKFKGQVLLINPMSKQIAMVLPETTGATAKPDAPAGEAQPRTAQAATQSETQRQSDDWQHTKSGQAGKQEQQPNTPSPQEAAPVLLNGALNVAGAPADSQTVPAKFSKRNNTLDHMPTMAFPLTLDEEQKRTVRDSVRGEGKPVVNIDPQITEALPMSVPSYDLPAAVVDAVPTVRGLKYVPVKDNILLVRPSNMIVVGKIGS